MEEQVADLGSSPAGTGFQLQLGCTDSGSCAQVTETSASSEGVPNDSTGSLCLQAGCFLSKWTVLGLLVSEPYERIVHWDADYRWCARPAAFALSLLGDNGAQRTP